MQFSAFVLLSLALVVSASPAHYRRAAFTLQNGKDAIALNQQFASLTANSPCTSGENACVGTDFAQCANGQFVTFPCAGGLICAALPLVNSAGTSITCTTAADRDARIAATGAGSLQRRHQHGNQGKGGKGKGKGNGGKGGGAQVASSTSAATSASAASGTASASAAAASSSVAAGNAAAGGGAASSGDPQTSLTLDPSVIAQGFANNGQAEPTAGQVASLTSTNNFINFCATVPNLKITNGQQIAAGSCNPAPMGIIAATTNMPSSKFVSPKNNDNIPANQNFTVSMAINNLATGNFVNADENFFAAPQQVNAQGDINGHSHIVIEAIPSLTTTTPTDPTKFTFFKGLNDPAQGGVLTAVVAGGLPAGTYRMASINTAANHQPVLVAVAQHGALDDMVYFTVS